MRGIARPITILSVRSFDLAVKVGPADMTDEIAMLRDPVRRFVRGIAAGRIFLTRAEGSFRKEGMPCVQDCPRS